MTKLSVLVVGGGIFGLWQAFELARRGHNVTLREAMPERQTGGASRFAGAMLAPDCEARGCQTHHPRARLRWPQNVARSVYAEVVAAGTLVVAAPRDQADLADFARQTTGHEPASPERISALEPELGGRFMQGLFFPHEAHLVPRRALDFLVSELRRMGATLHFGTPRRSALAGCECRRGRIDCRGLAAQDQYPDMRGVRGEMAILSAPDVHISRPVRLLHPRFRLYAVPWGDGLYMIGATQIESQDGGPVQLRSALDLLGTAYALAPAFGEAQILELSAGVRPSFADNIPKIIVRGRTIGVNGAPARLYARARHGRARRRLPRNRQGGFARFQAAVGLRRVQSALSRRPHTRACGYPSNSSFCPREHGFPPSRE